MNMYTIRNFTIPEGNVKTFVYDGIELWRQIRHGHVVLGDSIAAAHNIDDSWEDTYGYDSQYGSNGNTSTFIISDSYADLIRNYVSGIHGGDYIYTKSFARSGDTVEDLMGKLDHAALRNSIAKADLVTVCIGANDVLQPAMLFLEDYINGNMDQMTATIQSNLAKLNDDAYVYSYKALLDKLYNINPKAQYVFTTIYNPYKYLYLEKSTANNNYKDGFLGPLMWCIPDALGDVAANAIRKAFLKSPVVENLFNKINELNIWAEQFVTSLNEVINNKVVAFGKPNVVVADTKAIFDAVPDRNISAPYHYNDLVNVEFTRGFVVENMDWGRFWDNVNWDTVLDNIDQVATEIINIIINEVIVPDADPHPEHYGHYALRHAITDAIGWNELTRYHIVFDANGGVGTMNSQTVAVLDGNKAYTTIALNTFTATQTNSHFIGWNTKPDGSGVSYSDGQLIELSSDVTLYAQWSTMYKVVVDHYFDSALHTSSDTGPMECYALWIEGTEQSDLGAFSNTERVYELPYGTRIGVIAQVANGDARSYITWNGDKVAGNSSDARWEFTLTSDVNIYFEWTYWLENIIYPQSYWNCYIETI